MEDRSICFNGAGDVDLCGHTNERSILVVSFKFNMFLARLGLATDPLEFPVAGGGHLTQHASVCLV